MLTVPEIEMYDCSNCLYMILWLAERASNQKSSRNKRKLCF